MPLSDLARIACTVGPGSFMGARVGVSLAKGLALPRAVPCVPMTTTAGHRARPSPRPVTVLIDARRGQAYAQVFEDRTRGELTLLPIRGRGGACPGRLVGVGRRDHHGRARPRHVSGSRSRWPARRRATTPPGRLRPLYFRAPDAKPGSPGAVNGAPPERLSVRSYAPGDAAALAALHARAFDAPQLGLGYWRGGRDTPPNLCVVAEADGTCSRATATASSPGRAGDVELDRDGAGPSGPRGRSRAPARGVHRPRPGLRGASVIHLEVSTQPTSPARRALRGARLPSAWAPVGATTRTAPTPPSWPSALDGPHT